MPNNITNLEDSLTKQTNPIDETKKDSLDNLSGGEKKERKKRESQPYTQYSKKELWEMSQNKQKENAQSVFQPDAISHISTGVLMLLEMVTTLPYTKTSQPVKDSLDASLSNASNVYLASKINENTTPLILIGMSFSAMTLEALKNKTLNRKVEEVEKEVLNSDSNNEIISTKTNEVIPQI